MGKTKQPSDGLTLGNAFDEGYKAGLRSGPPDKFLIEETVLVQLWMAGYLLGKNDLERES